MPDPGLPPPRGKKVLYRRNVALILARAGGEILVCQRTDFRNSWQFPQGGAKKGESNLEALQREVREEISLLPESYRVVLQRGPYRYLYRNGIKKEGFDGQEQIYFLAKILGGRARDIRVDRREFRAFRWVLPEAFRLDWVFPPKQTVYEAIFQDFFGISLK